MRSILMIVVITLCTIGCGTKDEGGTDQQSTTPVGKESLNSKQLAERRAEWKRTRLTLHEGYELVDPSHEPVEIHLDDLSFKHAFSIQFRAKGEGRTFWWRGDEYTTNLEEYGNKIEYPSVDKE